MISYWQFSPQSKLVPVDSDRAFCEAMLPKVSRTFALCIRLLPRDLEYPVLLAYLLCRIADTIEDTADLSGAQKQELLATFSGSLEETGPMPATLQAFFARRANDEERLVAQTDAVLREYRALPAAYRQRIRPWVQEAVHDRLRGRRSCPVDR